MRCEILGSVSGPVWMACAMRSVGESRWRSVRGMVWDSVKSNVQEKVGRCGTRFDSPCEVRYWIT
jgi:hypothetical protein